jgi:hypothetical protein
LKTTMIEHRKSKQWSDLIRKRGIAFANLVSWSSVPNEYGVAAVLTVHTCTTIIDLKIAPEQLLPKRPWSTVYLTKCTDHLNFNSNERIMPAYYLWKLLSSR